LSSLSSIRSSSDDELAVSDDDENSFMTEDLELEIIYDAIEYYERVSYPVVNTSVTYGKRLLIDDFNEAQCISNFWFRKTDLKIVGCSPLATFVAKTCRPN
jgi:hypothetical protein